VADTERLLAKAAAATRASKYVAFSRDGDLLRDVVALANVGGGVVLTETTPDVGAIRRQLAFDDVELAALDRGPVLVVGPAGESPLTLDSQGAFFRHGAKSVPASRDDLRKFVERRLAAARKRLIVDIKRVITAPEGSEIVAIERSEDETGERVIRITTDVHAPLYRAVDFDITHPYRQKELVEEVNGRLREDKAINAYEFQAIKRTHDIDPEFVHQPRFGTSQYSQAFVDWLVERIERDPEFVTRARSHYHELRVSASKSRG
jgi:EC042_2821-lke REase